MLKCNMMAKRGVFMKKILFDLDNTLLFISKDWTLAYKKFIEKYHLDISPEELFHVIGTFEKNINNIVVTNKTLCDYINDNSSIYITEEMLDDLLEAYKNVPLLKTDEIFDVLQYLSQKYELIVYSNWFTKDQINRLKRYHLNHFFSEIYGWDTLPKKPSKEGLKAIIKNNNVNEYISIGDSIEYDLQIPDSMGMDTIFYNRKQIEQDKYKEIYHIVELKSIL